MRMLTDHGKAALVTAGGEVTYAGLLERAEAWRALIGEASGTRTVIFAENRPEWIYAFYGSWKAGAVNVTVDFLTPADELRYILDDCRPRTVVCSSRTRPVLRAALEKAGQTARVIDIDEAAFTAATGVGPDFPDSRPEATALILYTSGTTGGPKGVMLSHDNLLVNIEAVSERSGIYTPDERVMALLPFHHILPLAGTVVVPLFVGATVVFCPALTPADILATLEKHAVTIMIGVPRLYQLFHKGIMDKIRASLPARLLFKLAARVGSPAFSRKVFRAVHRKFGGHLKHLVSGGAAIEPAVHGDMLTLGFGLLNGYGLTETAPMVSFTRPGEGRVGSAGRLIHDAEVRFEGDEILVRGRNVMQGYWGKPAETAEAMAGGWFHTGDLGRLGADGNLCVTGRKKEIIVLANGKNVNPEEIEKKVLAMTDTVADIGVYAAGDILAAVILPDLAVLRRKGILNIGQAFRMEILDAYNRAVPPYRRLLRFDLVNEELPRTRLGKLKRYLLPGLAAGGGAPKAAAEEPDLTEYRALHDYLQRQAEKPVHPDDHIEIDLGLDSLDKVALLAWMGAALGVAMSEKELMHHPTVRQLALFSAGNRTRIEPEEADWGAILARKDDLVLPRSGRLHLVLKHAAGAAARLYFRIGVEGIGNLPEPPFIFAPNHQSVADGVLTSVALPDRILRRTFFFAKDKHFQGRLLAWLAVRTNILVVNIDLDLRLALGKMAEVLRRGNNLIIFPEGTRTRDGALGNFKKTFAILAREIGVPVVPVSIKGAFEALPRNSVLPRFSAPLSISFLPPVRPEGLSYEEIRDEVRNRIALDLARR